MDWRKEDGLGKDQGWAVRKDFLGFVGDTKSPDNREAHLGISTSFFGFQNSERLGTRGLSKALRIDFGSMFKECFELAEVASQCRLS